MYLQILKNTIVSRNLTKADIARLAGVSRAAVSKWFHSEPGLINVESKTLLSLAKGLQISPEIFLRECLDLKPFGTRFLWDHLYPSMEKFVQALVQNRLPALARLVQVLGFKEAQAVVGKKAVAWFGKYKKYIKPLRRKQLEVLWPLYQSQD